MFVRTLIKIAKHCRPNPERKKMQFESKAIIAITCCSYVEPDAYPPTMHNPRMTTCLSEPENRKRNPTMVISGIQHPTISKPDGSSVSDPMKRLYANQSASQLTIAHGHSHGSLNYHFKISLTMRFDDDIKWFAIFACDDTLNCNDSTQIYLCNAQIMSRFCAVHQIS